ncbi:MAG: hypothetical protein CMH56_16880 [Myxococcales bacterium]|nr:hypothetical protein [Myxococcales bacterium]|tara:strand:- start:414 stop:1007 length:594 start_codon:yes stop_codon:yes gene_type:complete
MNKTLIKIILTFTFIFSAGTMHARTKAKDKAKAKAKATSSQELKAPMKSIAKFLKTVRYETTVTDSGLVINALDQDDNLLTILNFGFDGQSFDMQNFNADGEETSSLGLQCENSGSTCVNTLKGKSVLSTPSAETQMLTQQAAAILNVVIHENDDNEVQESIDGICYAASIFAGLWPIGTAIAGPTALGCLIHYSLQ